MRRTEACEQGQIIAMVNYMTQTLLALIVLANIIVILTKALASAKRVSEVLAQESCYAGAAPKRRRRSPARRALSLKACVSLIRTAGEDAVEGVSFSIQPGQTLGIIGGTGCGKTTLVRLLSAGLRRDGRRGARGRHGCAGIYLPAAARQDRSCAAGGAACSAARCAAICSWARKTRRTSALWKALEVAQGADFVRGKPDGLDTPVEEGGKNLSGGQKPAPDHRAGTGEAAGYPGFG